MQRGQRQVEPWQASQREHRRVDHLERVQQRGEHGGGGGGVIGYRLRGQAVPLQGQDMAREQYRGPER